MKTSALIAAILILGVFGTETLSKNTVLNASNVTIISLDAHDLIVSRTIKRKTDRLRFTLNADTVITGNPGVGSKVTVHYRVVHHKNIAISIQTRQTDHPQPDPPLPD